MGMYVIKHAGSAELSGALQPSTFCAVASSDMFVQLRVFTRLVVWSVALQLILRNVMALFMHTSTHCVMSYTHHLQLTAAGSINQVGAHGMETKHAHVIDTCCLSCCTACSTACTERC